MWRIFRELKSVFRNIYALNFNVGSGLNEMDALLEASKYHWVFKKNTSINARYLRQGRTAKVKCVKAYEDVSSNLVQCHSLLPEAMIYFRFKDHLIINHSSDGITTTTATALTCVTRRRNRIRKSQE